MSDQRDPGSGWFGGNQGARGGPSRSVRLIATAVAAFVTVLGLVLFLHLYICYVRRRNRRRSAADADDLPSAFNMTATTGDADPAAAKPGLEPSAIAALPSLAYCKVREPSCSECAICLAAMREGDAVRVLPPCGHVFHLGCVDKWLASSSSCPVCRAVVAPPTAAMWAHEKVEGEAAAGGGSAPARLGASLWRMVSRERPSGRRLHAVQAVQDLERQQQHTTMQ